eukprot:546596-Prymnesium_polylepis.1
MRTGRAGRAGLLVLLAGRATCTEQCVFDAGGARFNLSSWAGRTITAPDSAGGTYNVSLCGNLPHTCIDSLTGTPMPPGSLFSMFEGEPSGTCWDVLARWDDLRRTVRLGDGLRLVFSHSFDAHLGCTGTNVTVNVDAVCNRSVAPAMDPIATGSKTPGACTWQLLVQTASPAICSPASTVLVLQDDTLSASVSTADDTTFGTLTALSRAGAGGVNVLRPLASALWSASFVTRSGTKAVEVSSETTGLSRIVLGTPSPTSLELLWARVPVAPSLTCNVIVDIRLRDGQLSY